MAAWINCGWTHLRVSSSTSVALSTVAITIQYNGNTEQTIFVGINSTVIYKDRSQIQIENIYLFCRSSFQPGTYSTLFSHPVHLVLSQNKICFLNLTTECTKDGQYFFFPFVIFFFFLSDSANTSLCYLVCNHYGKQKKFSPECCGKGYTCLKNGD